MIHIQEATLEDLERLTPLCKEFFSKTAFDALTEWDDSQAKEGLTIMIESDTACVFVAKDGDKIIGTISGYVSPIWFSNDIMGQEVFWYVDPEYRGKVGTKLLNALEFNLKEKGATIINMVHLCNGMDLTRFFYKKGYRKSEEAFIKRVV